MKRLPIVFGLLTLVLLALPIPLRGPFVLVDCLAPVFGVAFLLHWKQKDVEECNLLLFLGICAILTALHLLMGTGERGYDLAVFCYLGLMWLFLRNVPFSSNQLLICGSILLGAILLGWLPEALRLLGWHSLPETGLCLITQNAEGTAMDFLHRRYAFLFGNPNLLGVFYPLPYAAILPALRERWQALARRQRFLWLLFLGVGLLPLCHTFSKHALLTGALLSGWLVEQFSWRRLRPIVIAGILALGLSFELTVLWVAFPVSARFPFLNFSPGVYSIHQKAYGKIVLQDAFHLITGRSAAELQKLYPQNVEKERARTILEEYNAMEVYEGYCNFMDPHNEYLNTLSLFGLAGLLAALWFFLRLGLAKQENQWLLCCYLIALLCCCLWDDLLSKRALWATLALVGGRTSKR